MIKTGFPILANIHGFWLTRVITWVILINFINLSVNFQESNLSSETLTELDDPIETLTELVYEWALDGDQDLIPDNGTEQEEKTVKKDKLWIISVEAPSPSFYCLYITLQPNHFFQKIRSGMPNGIFSPPDVR